MDKKRKNAFLKAANKGEKLRYTGIEHEEVLELFLPNNKSDLREGLVENKGDIFLLPRGDLNNCLTTFNNWHIHAQEYMEYAVQAEEILLTNKNSQRFSCLEEAVEVANKIKLEKGESSLAGACDPLGRCCTMVPMI